MPQEQARTIPLPKEIEDAVALAQGKVQVLQEKEVDLIKSNKIVGKEVAEKTLLLEELDGKLETLKSVISTYESTLKEVSTEKETAVSELEQITSEVKVKTKEVASLETEIKEASEKLAGIVKAQRLEEANTEEARIKREKDEAKYKEKIDNLISVIKNF